MLHTRWLVTSGVSVRCSDLPAKPRSIRMPNVPVIPVAGIGRGGKPVLAGRNCRRSRAVQGWRQGGLVWQLGEYWA